MRQRNKTLKPAALNAENQKALHGWKLMGGEIEWSALDTIAALVGAEDVEVFIRGLLEIRARQAKVSEAQAQ